MSAQCTQCTIGSQDFFSRKVSVRFDGGGLLLRETERRISLFPRLAACLTDYSLPGQDRAPRRGAAAPAHLWPGPGLRGSQRS